MSREPTDEAVQDNRAPVSVPVSSINVFALSQPSFLAWLASSETALFQLGRARSRSGTPATSSAPISAPGPTNLMLMIDPCGGASAIRVIATDFELAVAPFTAVARAASACRPSPAPCHTVLYGGPSVAVPTNLPSA